MYAVIFKTNKFTMLIEITSFIIYIKPANIYKIT